MKLELIEKAPIAAALKEIEQLAESQRDPVLRDAYAEMHTKLETAITAASNPEFADGVDTETFAAMEGISLDGARKRIKRHLIAKGHAEKRGGRYVVFVDRISA